MDEEFEEGTEGFEEYGLMDVYQAVIEQRPSDVDRLMKRKRSKDPIGFDANAVDDYGRTLLYHAVKHGFEDVVEILITNGCEVDLGDDDETTPLHLAAQKGNIGIGKQLLPHLSNINARTCESVVYGGYTPLHLAIQNREEDFALFLIQESKKRLDEQKGEPDDCFFDPNLVNKCGMGVLHLIATAYQPRVLTEFLTFPGVRVDIQAKGRKNISPLMLASSRSLETMIDDLIEAGANLNLQDDEGDTALHHALKIQIQRLFSFTFNVDDGSYECFFRLILAGADVTIQNEEEDTPMDLLSPEASFIFSFIGTHKSLFSSFRFEDIQRWGAKELSVLGLKESEEKELLKNIEGLIIERKEIAKEEEERGSCPFVDPSKSKLRRQKPPPAKYIQKQDPPSSSPFAPPSMPAGHPAMGMGGGGSCPFGFGKEKKEEKKEGGEGKCPFGFGDKKEAPVEEQVPPPSACPFTAFTRICVPLVTGVVFTSTLLLLD